MKQVLVTGISGWIAQFCAVELMKAGYAVKGSLRSMHRIPEVEKALGKVLDITGKLSFCELDLLKDDGWDEAVQGCEYVMHVASPFVIENPKDEQELIEPAEQGTLRALRAAKKAGVKRVVLTSSIAAMAAHMKKGSFNQDSWTDLGDKGLTAYEKSKTIAERIAWSFIEDQKNTDNPLELVVINPGFVMGPSLSEDIDGASLDLCKQLLQRKMPAIPDLNFVMVDVRDVAKHHLKAMELPGAKNKRFISALAVPMPMLEMAKTFKQLGYSVPTAKLPSFIVKLLALFDKQAKGMLPYLGRSVGCDNSQTLKLLDWEPVPIEKTLADMAESVQAVLDKK